MLNTTKKFRLLCKNEHGAPKPSFVFCLLITGLFCLTAATNTVTAATYYVDPNGNDANDGLSVGEAWKTLSHAEDNVSGGDTVYVREGSYGNYTLDANYISYVTFESYPAETAEVNSLKYQNFGDIIPAYYKFKGFKINTVYIQGYSHIELNDCTFEGDGYTYPYWHVSSEDSTAIYLRNATDINIIDCNIYGVGTNWETRWPNATKIPADADANNFGMGYTYGLRTTVHNTDNLTVDGCTIRSCDVGMLIEDSTNTTITNNTIYNITSDGIEIGGPSANTGGQETLVAFNEIYNMVYFEDPCEGALSAHNDCLQFFSTTHTNIVIRGNKLYNSEQGLFARCGSGDQSSNWLVENNLIYNIRLTSRLRSISDITVRNNVFDGTMYFDPEYNTSQFNYVYGNIFHTIDFFTDAGTIITDEDYNIYYKTTGWMDDHNWGSHTVNLNEDMNAYKALFNDYDNQDFTLAEGSIAIDFGDSSNAPATDILGNSRDATPDAGCYEYVASDPNNQPPVLDAIGSKSVNENSLLTFDVNATDPNGDTITYSAQNLPTGATFSSQTFSWTPGYSQAGSYQVTFIASDGNAQDSETITITVNNVNRAPVLAAIGNKSVNEGSLLNFSVSATDPDSDTVTYSAQNLPSGATFSSQTFNWTPGYSQAGSFEVTFIASDGTEEDSETITITVGNTNRAPVLAAIGNKTVNENTTLNFSVSATDADGNPITYSVENLPGGAAFASQNFIWTPGYDQAGSFEVTFNASDGQDQDSETITITVNNVNRAPVLDAIIDKSVDDGTLLTFAVNATDPDGDTIEYSATGLPSGAAFSGQTFSWTPAHDQAGNSYQVTFIASDGQLQDSQAINIVVSDTSAPTVTNSLPTAGSIQAPLNNLITLNITDAGKGVNADSVTIKVNNNIVYSGNTEKHSSIYGECYRIGTKADYRFIYQPNEMFDFDQTVSITANATDLAGNAMPEHSYSFKTEMRSFGENKKVSSQDIGKGAPGTVCDGGGNIWVAWHAGLTDSRDIYLSKLTSGAENFGAAVQLTDNSVDQCNPAIALDDSDKLYVVWQDNRRGNWDIYVSTSTDGVNWSAETRVTDSNDNQINPAMVIDGQSPNRAYIAWQDDRNGNQDIYVATSQNSFLTTTISQITSDGSNQLAPAITADSSNTIYVVWADARNASTDIYGAASDSGPWTNVAVVSNAYNQSGPAIAAESAGSVLHLLWVDDTSGDRDIYYAFSDGLPSSPLSGSSIIDDTSAADQWAPAIVTTGSTGNNLKVFACWKDGRNLSGTNSDTDLYFARLNSGSGTNVLVGDDSTNSSQSEPAMAADEYGNPYLVWTDGRSTNQEIYYAGSTFVAPVVLESENVIASSGATVGTEPAAINDVDDVSAIVPSGACPSDVQITISRIENPRKHTLERLSLPYEFGPSGLEFDQPVTITIPYAVSDSTNTASVYWYNTLTGTLSQEGITNVETIVISPTLHALQFRTTHFTEFFIGGGIAAAVGGGGGGGGCSISETGQGSVAEFLVPYIGLAAAMVIIRLRDMRNRKARNIKKG